MREDSRRKVESEEVEETKLFKREAGGNRGICTKCGKGSDFRAEESKKINCTVSQEIMTEYQNSRKIRFRRRWTVIIIQTKAKRATTIK